MSDPSLLSEEELGVGWRRRTSIVAEERRVLKRAGGRRRMRGLEGGRKEKRGKAMDE
jgi:hypothetical protein